MRAAWLGASDGAPTARALLPPAASPAPAAARVPAAPAAAAGRRGRRAPVARARPPRQERLLKRSSRRCSRRPQRQQPVAPAPLAGSGPVWPWLIEPPFHGVCSWCVTFRLCLTARVCTDVYTVTPEHTSSTLIIINCVVVACTTAANYHESRGFLACRKKPTCCACPKAARSVERTLYVLYVGQKK